MKLAGIAQCPQKELREPFRSVSGDACQARSDASGDVVGVVIQDGRILLSHEEGACLRLLRRFGSAA